METPENVSNFLDLLSDSIRASADKDFETLRKFKDLSSPGSQPLMQWDMPYLTQKYKKYKYT
jgi:Zn-dependent oligopeptidase